ncbi:recombinase family protein [Acidithiobacillus thiooxidans]|uniref:Recombinase family protein n=2 Tax=Acidithiobacillus thiooxidans TaxID=930 RepID=A0A5P9XPS0_ACITH|nr:MULTISPECIES: recombinase family protein [Acidithiobacillus]MBU2742962.1 recombinase family protein [Acidithiobacillus albertensis]MBU2750952.1 recombinase family protein [Acidithiobacillus thiooxidans]MBU2792541.1 recombinase family protein [Acidithiobacillus thiooxidans]MBU2837130.1 recombinase family protein [Acidithiobacillus thiooxidans]QFX95363.1 hypothetical protein GCD22_00921 [Acidithiobacillus thiooxidans ATCC 19377]
MPTAAIYARYSTDNQRETSIDDQIRRCKEFAERHNYTVPDNLIFSDSAISGSSAKTAQRVGYAQLLAAWMAGQFQCLIVDELSRLSRSIAEISRLNDRITKTGVRLLTVDGKDSLNPNWRFGVEITAVIAEHFLRETAFRVKRGMRGQLERGYDVASPPYGYNTMRVGQEGQPAMPGEQHTGMRWIIDPEQANVVKTIFNLRKSGRSLNQICATLNRQRIPPPRAAKKPDSIAFWRPGTVNRLLSNQIFRGIFVGRDSELSSSAATAGRNQGPAILLFDRPNLRMVDDETWTACNRSTGSKAMYGGGNNPFSGLITCSQCGTKLSLSGKGKDGKFVQAFYCASCAQRGTVGHHLKSVGVGHTARAGIEAMLKFVLNQILENPQIQKEFRDRLRAKLSGNRLQELSKLKQECDQAEITYSRALDLLKTIGHEDNLEKRITSLYGSWKMLEIQYKRIREEEDQIDKVVIAKQLNFNPRNAATQLFDSRLDPARIRAVLSRIFPKIIALGKTSRFVSLFEVEICPGALVATETGSTIIDTTAVTIRIRLTASPDRTKGWTVEQIQLPGADVEATGKVGAA